MNCEAPTGPRLSSQPIVAFTGPFGSGKTEVAIGYALAALASGRAPCIIDLDIVTPYFRVGDYQQELTARGLRVVAPPGPLASFELPALPPEIAGALGQEDLHVVLDVGGDPIGAQLLRTYTPQISARGCDLWMVVNPFRPSSATPALLSEQARAIEASCSLPLTALVGNPHLGGLTQLDHINAGWEVIRQTAERLQLPVIFLAVAERFAQCGVASEASILPLRLLLRLPWE
jgi:hypothetical protein